MKHLFFSVVLLGILCSCRTPEEPLYTCRFHAEKDAYMPNGWRFSEDGFFSKPEFFQLKQNGDKYDDSANLFTVKTGETPAMNYYCGYYDIKDDSIVDVVADANGTGSFSLGVVFCDADQNYIGERHQGFNLLPVKSDKDFKNYRFRLFFLANENSKARFVRLMYIVDPSSTLTLKNISLNISPYEIEHEDSTYLKFKKQEKEEGYRK